MLKSSLLVAATAVCLASCSGNLGGGGSSGIGGLSGPVAPNQSQAYPAPTPLDRERTLEDTVAFAPASSSLALPPVMGFAIAIDLSAPAAAPQSAGTAAASRPDARTRQGAPAASPAMTTPAGASTPAGGSTPAAGRGAVYAPHRLHTLAIGDLLVAASGASPSATDAASAVPSGSAASAPASPSPSPGVARPAKPTHRPSPRPSAAGPVAEVKVTIYPDYAPKPPDPKIKSPVARVALVRGYLKLPSDVTLSSLAAVKFTIPTDELTPGRGFTIALFDERKKKKPHLLVADTDATAVKNVVGGTSDDIIELQKGNPYSFVLFADALPPSPPPAGYYNAPGQMPGVPAAGASPLPGTSGVPQVPPANYNQPYGTPTLTGTIPPNIATFPPH